MLRKSTSGNAFIGHTDDLDVRADVDLARILVHMERETGFRIMSTFFD
jgi:hypothetical protein